MRWPWQTPIVYAIGAPWGFEAGEAIINSLGRFWYKHYAVLFPEQLEMVVGLAQPRFTFFLNWSHRVPESVLCMTEPVNFHAAPLPYGRGGGPIENMILHGHDSTVVSAHLMTSELDAGPIYGQSGPVSLLGTKEEIQARFVKPVSQMAVQIARGKLTPKPQVGEPTYFKRLPKEAYDAFWIARGGHV